MDRAAVILPLVNEGASWDTHAFPRLRCVPLARSRPVASKGEFAERLTACLGSRPSGPTGLATRQAFEALAMFRL